MSQRKITTLLNQARKEAWLQGSEAGRRAALVQDAGLSRREAAVLCGCSEGAIRKAVEKVRRAKASAEADGELSRREAEAWKILHGQGLHTVGDVEERVVLVTTGEVESNDPENLRRLAGIVGVDVARLWPRASAD